MASAGALQRLESHAHQIPMRVNPAAAQLAIVNPLHGRQGSRFDQVIPHDPPTEERVMALKELAGASL